MIVSRPALVISSQPVGPNGLLLWALMITNAERPQWPGDIMIPNAEQLGLLIPSKIRTAKIAPVETSKASLIGTLDARTLQQVRRQVRDLIA